MKKPIAVALAVLLVIGAVIGGSMAWLSDDTTPVLNTFIAGDIDITLKESFNTDSDNDGKVDAWQQQMIPGVEYGKDPVVTVDPKSEDCYLFIKFDELNDAKTYLIYTSNLTDANGWKQDAGIPSNVWYRVVENTDIEKEWHLLAEDKVTVNSDTVTEDSMKTAKNAALAYTAYAIQLDKDGTTNFTPKEAWDNVPKTTNV